MRQLSLSLTAVGLLVLASGCGSSNKKSSSSSAAKTSAPAVAGGALKIEADDDGGLYFEQRKLTAKAGKVTLVMENPKSSGKSHGIGIEGKGVDKDGKIVAPGQSSTITVSLKPGTYTYYCPIPAHEKAGMKGTLTVQ
jgi:uncharacterized cupredoxin-like copper-binding protein